MPNSLTDIKIVFLHQLGYSQRPINRKLGICQHDVQCVLKKRKKKGVNWISGGQKEV